MTDEVDVRVAILRELTREGASYEVQQSTMSALRENTVGPQLCRVEEEIFLTAASRAFSADLIVFSEERSVSRSLLLSVVF